jgi:hypothetical protein
MVATRVTPGVGGDLEAVNRRWLDRSVLTIHWTIIETETVAHIVIGMMPRVTVGERAGTVRRIVSSMVPA